MTIKLFYIPLCEIILETCFILGYLVFGVLSSVDFHNIKGILTGGVYVWMWTVGYIWILMKESLKVSLLDIEEAEVIPFAYGSWEE